MSNAAHTYVAVVDDDESLCRSLARFLRAAGIQPITYASAEAFLADTKHPTFDCLLLDIRLGGMSGLELAERLAASGSATPVIFITAQDEPETRAQALHAGCVAYLRKTDSAETLLAAIRKASREIGQTCEPRLHSL